MKQINIDDELHAEIKALAEQRGETIAAITERALQAGLTALQAGLPRDLYEWLGNQHHHPFAHQLAELLQCYKDNRNMPAQPKPAAQPATQVIRV